jgi:membrane protein
MDVGQWRRRWGGLAGRLRRADLGLNAAAVAYHAFLAMVPLCLALLGAAAFIGGSEAALGRVDDALAALAPEPVREFITGLLREADSRVGGLKGWLIPGSVLVAVFLGSRAVMALQRALAQADSGTERRPALQMRLVAAALTAGGGLVLLLASSLLVVGRHLFDLLAEITGLGMLDEVWAWLRLPATAAGVFGFLVAFYRWGPPQPLPHSWLAAAVGTAGVLGSSLVFGAYLRLAPTLGATFGVLGAVALALVWLYLGAFSILLGALVAAPPGNAAADSATSFDAVGRGE